MSVRRCVASQHSAPACRELGARARDSLRCDLAAAERECRIFATHNAGRVARQMQAGGKLHCKRSGTFFELLQPSVGHLMGPFRALILHYSYAPQVCRCPP